jgi:DNA-binding FadR family transcriptional regulator
MLALDRDPRTPDKATLVNSLIAQFERDLGKGRYKPGSFMGTRQELCAAYGVTSPIFFQASRVLIHRGLVELRPGNRGGLFAADHSLEQVAKRMATYLECIGVDLSDALPVSRLLQEFCVRGATGRVTIETAVSIRATTAEVATCDAFDRGRLLSRMFHLFADASGNVVLALLYRVITELLLDVVTDFAAGSDIPITAFIDQTIRMAEAVIAADPEQSAFAYQQFRDALARRHALQQAQRRYDKTLPSFAERDGAVRNLPERLAAHILREIRLGGWPVGEKLGNEPELMLRYGVSRATFRQALRLLEEYSAVETRRGPKGGVLIASPSAALINQTALSLLVRRGADLGMTRPLLASQMTLALDLALSYGETARAAVLEACRTARQTSLAGGLSVLTSTLLQQARVKVLEVFVRLLGELDARVDEQPPQGAEARFGEIMEALAKGVSLDDRSAARCAMAELTRRFGVGSPAFFH